MSAEATGWVFRHSPFTGSTLLVHLAIADSVNDQYDNEFWMEQKRLAAKTRASRQTVNVCLAQLIEDGFLADLGEVPKTRGVRKYLFLYPDTSVVYESRRHLLSPVARDDKSDNRPVARDDTTCRQRRQVPVARDDTEPKEEPKRTQRPSGGRAAPAAPPPTELPLNGHGNGDGPPLAQEMVAFFVDVSREFGAEPTPKMKGQVGREVAKLVAIGKPRRVIRRAIGRLAETGKQHTSLDWLIGEVERELAGELK
jgi:hypothetical protein